MEKVVLNSLTSIDECRDEGRSLVSAALITYRNNHDVLGEASCLVHSGEIGRLQADYTLAIEDFTDAVRLYQRLKALVGAARCLAGLAAICWLQDYYECADGLYDTSANLFRRAGDRAGLTRTVYGKRQFVRRMHRWDETLVRFNDCEAD